MDDAKPKVESPDRDTLLQTIRAMRSTIEDLRDRRDELEDERERLLEENRALRREITQSRLIADLKTSSAVVDDGTPPAPVPTPSAEQLYHTLPSTFTYAEFFKIAENAGMALDEARGALRSLLAKDLIVQEGSRLKKENTEASMAEDREAEDRERTPRSRLPAA